MVADTKSSVPKSTGLIADTESWVPKSTGHRKTDPPPPTTEKDITCDRSHNSYDLCAIKGPTVLDPTTATFFVVYPTSSTPEKPMEERVRPYPRKHENFTMSRIREVTLVSGHPTPKCDVQHHAPAIVFSAAGYTGNVWHDFNDGLIPLYVTINTIFPDQDVVLVISKARDWWVSKYRDLLHSFSKHPIINLDNDTATHCFPSMAAGMISHGFMTIDPKLMPNSETFTHFRSFLDKAYGQNHEVPNENHNKPLVYNTPEPRRPIQFLRLVSHDLMR
ncbi:hypothetical protein CJ030_MR7G003007 [Morella rubra]|uniref:Uncharacterized protein n=1 Tax=Morella rubra TaxID=262757 RepID=A0A6A1V5H9_9ROSI|nr:hypothetical protein CJ030_MR7G003007 [Morella rubra]